MIVMRITYCLLIYLQSRCKIRIGKLGFLDFDGGYYIYVGSAPSYKGYYIPRIERHFRKNKKKFWHVDYFLEKAKPVDFFFSRFSECETANRLSKKFDSVKRFGCSDCRCGSHLFYTKRKPI